jgi:prepilin-type N-terminal cleavage/methylation domain-containing protein
VTEPAADGAETRAAAGARGGERGFTLLELLVTISVMALITGMVLQNLGMFVPEARLDGSGAQIVRTIDWVRSEARIQARKISVDFDLDHARWRIVYPPEVMLTRDQDAWTLEEFRDDWQPLEKDVVFAGAGDAKNGLAKKGIYRLTFDEHGFTGDQVVAMKLESEPELVWSLVMRGLAGTMDVEKSTAGQVASLESTTEGAF